MTRGEVFAARLGARVADKPPPAPDQLLPWEPRSPLPTARRSFAAAVLDGQVGTAELFPCLYSCRSVQSLSASRRARRALSNGVFKR